MSKIMSEEQKRAREEALKACLVPAKNELEEKLRDVAARTGLALEHRIWVAESANSGPPQGWQWTDRFVCRFDYEWMESGRGRSDKSEFSLFYRVRDSMGFITESPLQLLAAGIIDPPSRTEADGDVVTPADAEGEDGLGSNITDPHS